MVTFIDTSEWFGRLQVVAFIDTSEGFGRLQVVAFIDTSERFGTWVLGPMNLLSKHWLSFYCM